ncbi:MAG: class II aldolase/adducin family protein [Myxococcota bacterium]|nr:class II aldolase/adducin family protein [Myxococcota bacterium]
MAVIPEHQLRRDILRFGHLCYERNLLVAMDGNLSCLLPSGDVLCTKAGCHKGFLTDEDLVVVDRSGKLLRGSGRPTSEMSMHLACYDTRPDIRAVVHTHPPMSIAFTIAGVTMARCVLPEVVLTLGTVPTVEYATTGTQDLASRVGQFIGSYDALLMDRHGAVCVGTSLLEAFCRLETMEHTAVITKNARDMGMVRTLPSDEAVRLRSMGLKRYGGPPSAVSQADAPGADLPEACLDCSGCDNPSPIGIAPESNLRMARIVSQALQAFGAADSVPAGEDQSEPVPMAPASSSAPPIEEALAAEVIRVLRAND